MSEREILNFQPTKNALDPTQATKNSDTKK